MKHAKELVKDPTLAQFSHFNAIQKYFHNNDSVVQLWDEPWSGRVWYNAEVRLTLCLEIDIY